MKVNCEYARDIRVIINGEMGWIRRTQAAVLNTSVRTDSFPADNYSETHKVTPVMAHRLNTKANVRPIKIYRETVEHKNFIKITNLKNLNSADRQIYIKIFNLTKRQYAFCSAAIYIKYFESTPNKKNLQNSLTSFLFLQLAYSAT